MTASDGDTEGGAPVTLIELSATGMPIVSTTHCDIPNVVRDGKSGLLAPERDVDGLAERLRWMIENSEKWPAMGKAGRDYVSAEFVQGLMIVTLLLLAFGCLAALVYAAA